MKYIKLKLEQIPKIMYSHECVISKINGKRRKNTYYEFTFVKSGELLVSSAEFGSHRITDNMFLFAPANVEYDVSLKGELHHACVAFFMDECEICDEKDIFFEKIDNKEKTIIESVYLPFYGNVSTTKTNDCVNKIVEEQKNPTHCYSNLYCSKNIVDLILSVSKKQILINSDSFSEEYYCEKVESFLFSNYGDSSLDMNSISNYVNLHPNYLSTIYKRHNGKTVINRLREIRIDEAKRLLSLNKYFVKDIAKMVGIPDYNYFSVFFKKSVGQSPEVYAYESNKKNV